MPINTRIDGNPASIHSTATWLRSQLQAAVHDCGTQVYKARTDAEAGWRGDASSGFQQTMSNGGHAIDGLHTDIGTLSQSFDQYADSLHTAQTGMQRAREIAQEGGLTINGDTIENPGPAPAIPPPLPIDGSATPQQVLHYTTAIRAGEQHQIKLTAFNQAKGEADRATSIMTQARNFGKDVWDDLVNKKYLDASDFTNGIGGHLIEVQEKTLQAEARRLESDASKFEDNYLNSPGGSDQAKLNEGLRYNNMVQASELDGEAGDLARIGGRIPVIGLAIAAAGVGWDIAHGKPAGKAIFSGALGTGATFTTEALVGGGAEAGTEISLLAAAGPVGAAIAVGITVGVGSDYAWDHWVPTDVKNKIEDGLDTAGHDIAGAAKSAGHDIAGAAKSVGHFVGSIF